MHRTIARLFATSCIFLVACDAVDVRMWSSEGGTIDIDSQVGSLSDCSVWNDGGQMQTDCDGAADEVSCDTDDEGVEVCSRSLASIATGDIEYHSVMVVFTAEPDAGHLFTGWEGCEGSEYELSDDGRSCSLIHRGTYDTFHLELAQTEADANIVARFEAE